MADRFNICSDLASAFKNLGFIDDINFHEFLYPSVEDLYKLVRFLVGRLAESSDVQKASNESGNFNSGDTLFGESNKSNLVFGNSVTNEDGAVGKWRAGTRDSNEEGWMTRGAGQSSVHKVHVAESNAWGDKQTIALGFREHFEKPGVNSLEELSTEKKMLLDWIAKTSKLQQMQDEPESLKAAEALQSQIPVEFCVQQLIDQIEARKDKLVKLEFQWSALRRSIEEKRTNLVEAVCVTKPDACEKLQRKKEIRREIASVSAAMKSREDEFSVLSMELEKQPKVASRGSFILRIKEITKNSCKQEIDIERILRDTRELQLESNSIQERLNRTYAVVDETIFREARKDPVARQAYRLLTRIHDCFEQTAQKVLLTDRTRRELADYEAKLTSMASRSLNVDKLRADLDAIRKENNTLETNLQNC